MNDFFPLNKMFIIKEHAPFEPVSMFFRYENWSTDEMYEIMSKIVGTAIQYYFPIKS